VGHATTHNPTRAPEQPKASLELITQIKKQIVHQKHPHPQIDRKICSQLLPAQAATCGKRLDTFGSAK